MKNLECNKLIAAILLAGLIGMVVGTFTDILYEPKLKPEKRGYQVAVEENAGQTTEGASAVEEVIKIGQLMTNANAELGKEAAKKCATCHSFDKGGAAMIGPNLWNIVGAKKGHMDNYAYSQSLLSKGGNWTYEELAYFLHSPKKFISGTKMSFIGIKKPEELANVIAYLRSLSDSPTPLPPVEK